MSLLKKLRRKYFPTQVEENLETRTALALEDICFKINTAMPQRLPAVEFDAHAKTCFYDTPLNKITYNEEDPDDSTIYEETGHFLHRTMRTNEARRIDVLQIIFYGVLAEAIGYFCSRLSGQQRLGGLEQANASICSWQKFHDELREDATTSLEECAVKLAETYDDLAKANAGIAEWKKKKALTLLGVVAWYAAEEHAGQRETIKTMTPELLYDAFLQFIEKQGQDTAAIRQCSAPERYVPLIERIISIGGWTEILPAQYRSLPTTLDTLIEKHTDELVDIWHTVGYELGRMLHDHYREQPATALTILKTATRAPENASFPATVELYRSLVQAGQTTYLPLTQAEEIAQAE